MNVERMISGSLLAARSIRLGRAPALEPNLEKLSLRKQRKRLTARIRLALKRRWVDVSAPVGRAYGASPS
jgi:hypothetical protein